MFVIVMGVTGAGKTTIGRQLAAALGWPFYDADDFHSQENVAKMAAGMPLDESDRGPWLGQLAALITSETEKAAFGILACSALRKAHREVLRAAGNVTFVYLKAERDLISARLTARRGHYMSAGLIDSQFEALEEPEDALTVPAALTPDEIVSRIGSELAKGVVH